jgi:hypothetical protein
MHIIFILLFSSIDLFFNIFFPINLRLCDAIAVKGVNSGICSKGNYIDEGIPYCNFPAAIFNYESPEDLTGIIKSCWSSALGKSSNCSVATHCYVSRALFYLFCLNLYYCHLSVYLFYKKDSGVRKFGDERMRRKRSVNKYALIIFSLKKTSTTMCLFRFLILLLHIDTVTLMAIRCARASHAATTRSTAIRLSRVRSRSRLFSSWSRSSRSSSPIPISRLCSRPSTAPTMSAMWRAHSTRSPCRVKTRACVVDALGSQPPKSLEDLITYSAAALSRTTTTTTESTSRSTDTTMAITTV